QTGIAEEEGNVPFLSRWSRRKLGQEVEEPSEEQALQMPVETVPEVDDDPVDLRTGKRMSELTDEDMPDLDSLPPDSDVSMFMAYTVSIPLRMNAPNKYFMKPKYYVWCVCAEYAEDYNAYLPMGDIVPHDLKRAIAREVGKLYERLTGRGVEVSREE